MTTETWVYEGPHDEVQVRLPSRRWLTAQRGSTHELMPNEANAIKDLPGWEPQPEPSKENQS